MTVNLSNNFGSSGYRRWLGFLILIASLFTIIWFYNTQSTLSVDEICGVKTVYKIIKTEDENRTINETYLKSVKCNDDTVPQNVTQKGNFWVFNNYVRATDRPKCLESITYTVTASFPFLGNIPTLVDRWRGPISVAVFAPGEDFFTAIDSIAYLRNCETDFIEKYVTFHLFFPEDHIPQSSTSLLSLYEDEYDCTKEAPYLNQKDNYRIEKKLLFPINVARNIAKDNAQTYIIFPSDIELYPSPGIIPKFLKMFSTKGLTPGNTIYITPVFEVQNGESIPETKSELRKLVQLKRARFFHINMCSRCHSFPYQNQWLLNDDDDKEMDIFSTTKRTGNFGDWEPFYISIKSDMALFAEKITWEGLGDKMVQAFVMCLLNYDFAVLNNVYLIHKPGFKQFRNSPSNLVAKTNAYKKQVLQPTLEKIFGRRDGCTL